MKFYLSRNPNQNTVTLSNFEPKRNPNYDKWYGPEDKLGRKIAGQMEIGTWHYWPDKGAPQFTKSFRLDDIFELFGVKSENMREGYCICLTEAEEFSLVDAKPINLVDEVLK